MDVATFLRSFSDRRPLRRTVSLLSSVKTFRRTMQGTWSPAAESSTMSVSPGQGRWDLVVIMARSVWPFSLTILY